MVSRVSTVAFEGVEARPVDVQVQIASGMVAFTIVGLGDKAVAESRERVRSALIASGLAMPAKRITVNLAPADMPKEGSHYDLPIALGVMAAIGAIPLDALDGFSVIGELALDGTISAVAGVLPAAIAANAAGKGLICPAPCGPEAAWASVDLDILAPRSLIQLANHFKGSQVLSRPQPALRASAGPQPDLRDIKGQESAKRALEIAAAGGRADEAEAARIGRDRRRQHAGDGAHRSVERQFADHGVTVQRVGGNGADRRHHAERDRQIVMAALLGQIGGRKIDGDAAGRQRKARGDQSGAHPLARFGHRFIAEPDDHEGDIARGDLHLNVDGAGFDALERHRRHARNHVTPARSSAARAAARLEHLQNMARVARGIRSGERVR